MKISDIEVFQIAWTLQDKPSQRSAFVRVHTDDALSGIGEASPMQGGIASLGIIARDIAPVLIGSGVRLFDQIGTEHIQLESTRVVSSSGVTHLRFTVVK